MNKRECSLKLSLGQVFVAGDLEVTGQCQDFCVWGGYSRGSPTRLPVVFEMQYARPYADSGG